MLRLTMATWWSLALVWFVTSYAAAEPRAAQATRRIDVKGYGATDDAAKKDALREALAKLQAELGQARIDYWQPDETIVQRHLLDGVGHGDEDVDIAPLGPQKTWVLHLKIPSDDALQNLDRQALRYAVAKRRIDTAMYITAALALLLAVVVGGIRVDDWTRSRYTRWLRLAGASILAGAVAVWWWVK